MTQQKKVLFFSLYSTQAWLFHHQVDATVATALKMRDCDVLITGCDGLFTSCYILRGGTGEIKKEVCKLCSHTSKAYFCDSFKLPYRQLRDFVADDDYNLAKQWVKTVDPANYVNASYQNLAIGQWVTSSIYTYFRITAKGLYRPDVRQVHKQYLMDGLVTYKAVSRLIDFYQPTHLFLLGARLAPSRIAFEVARQRNIDIIVQERGFINDSYIIVDNHTCMDTKPALNLISAWKNIPLNNSELLQVKKYWLEREIGQNLNLPSFYNYHTHYSSIRRQLNIPDNAKIFAVFTSSEDELSMAKNYAEMTQQLEMIERLMEIFADRDEYLVIRHHPNIGSSKYMPAQIDFIVEAYQQSLSVPKNVRIVMPSEELTSYALLWHTDAAISFFSTIAIECVAKGIPTAALDHSIYHAALRYVINQPDVESLRTLVDSLLSDSAKISLEDLRKLYRFTNAYFFKFCNQFRSFNAQGLNFDSNDQLQPGIDPTLDKVCNRILYGTSLYNLPTREDQQRSVVEENDFLEKYLLEITDFRQKVKHEKLTGDTRNITYPSVGLIKFNYQNEPEKNDYLSQSIKQYRYQEINEYCVNFELNNHCKRLEDIINLLGTIPEEYIILSHSNIQYHESIILSAMEILLADVEQEISGVRFGGWLPINQNMMEKEKFLPQEIFTQRNPSLSYEKAITTLPWLKYPTSLLAFSLMRKKELVKVLDMSIHLPTRKQAAELLFIFLQGARIHKIEKPMLFIHEIPESVQKILREEELIALQKSLNLKDINLIIFPDWNQPEESIGLELQEVIRTLATHPDTQKTTLLIDTNNITVEDAEMFLSSVAMNLLMEEDLDMTEELEISLIGELNNIQCQALLPRIQARIILNNENQAALTKLSMEKLPQCKLESFQPSAV